MIYYVDVDDTLIRTVGTKAIPIPQTLRWLKSLDMTSHQLFLWSRGGSDYAKGIAVSLGIESLFTAFLPKPDVMVDDQGLSDWTHMRQIHPNQLRSGDPA